MLLQVAGRVEEGRVEEGRVEAGPLEGGRAGGLEHSSINVAWLVGVRQQAVAVAGSPNDPERFVYPT